MDSLSRNDLKNTLSLFKSITLEEMDSVKLLDRTDTKYAFHIKKLPEVLNFVLNDYRLLVVNGTSFNRYKTLYFDTDKFDFYLKHHNERLNRLKVRFRSYVDTDLHFFEIKFKNNKDRTIKKRIPYPILEKTISGKALELLEELSPITDIKEKIWVNYTRLTFVSIDFSERVTVDLDLTYIEGENEISFPELVIGEIKQNRMSHNSVFVRAMKNVGIHSISISKYCLGIIKLHPEIKHNTFKPKLRILNRILNADS